ncbi:DUF2182 domain-containing protein [Arhodomonas sp. AD133]|uniref:DUF2182 domain-containing protein n=1 Tax=Arhodomonas sp. AD133 TaxID=3415009 RepID=UPI003EBAA03F
MSEKGLRILRDERSLLMASLALATVVSWLYLIRMAGGMSAMPADSGFRAWPTFIMWAVMMIGMMVPTAMPGILTLAAAERRMRAARAPTVAYLIAIGYVLAWTAFSVGATAAQWVLHELALLSAAQSLNDPTLAGGLLVVAGAFQLTPVKHACLRYCRSPLGLLVEGFPSCPGSAVSVGMRLGLYCVGCCWALMALMFAGGVMSLFWMALLTFVILLEKVVANWHGFSNLLAAGLVVYGVWLMLGA